MQELQRPPRRGRPLLLTRYTGTSSRHPRTTVSPKRLTPSAQSYDDQTDSAYDSEL